MQYILVSDKLKLILDAKEYQHVVSDLNTNKKFIAVQGQLINAAFIRGVYEKTIFDKQELDELSKFNKRRCRKCGNILEVGNDCPCWDKPSMREDGPLLRQGDKILADENGQMYYLADGERIYS